MAVDTETMGLHTGRDRLCLVQLSAGDGVSHLVQFAAGQTAAPNLTALLDDPKVTKLFHFARFDLAVLKYTFGVMPGPVYCTKIASRLVRTFTDRHGLKDLARDLLNVELSKQQQSSDWGAPELTTEQLRYAAADVLYLHRLRERTRRDADAGGADGARPGLLCLPADPSRARPGGLGRRGHIRALSD